MLRFLRAGFAAIVVIGVGLNMAAPPAAAAPRTWTKVEMTTQPYLRPAATGRGAGTGAIDPNLAGPSKNHLDPQLRADLAEQMRHAQTYDAGAVKQSRTGSTDDGMTVDQCMSGWESITEDWFYYNHFSACRITTNVVTFYRCDEDGCTVKGALTGLIVFLGRLSHTKRSFTWFVYPRRWRPSGEVDAKRVISIKLPCGKYNDGGHCKSSPSNGYNMELGEFVAHDYMTLIYSTSTTPRSNTPHPQDKISHFKFAPDVQIKGMPPIPANPPTIVRCDNAKYITGAGCTFTGAYGTFWFDYNYANYKESVEFVWTAIFHLDRLIRDPVGLYVPGGDFVQPATGYKEPLTRNYYGNTKRDKARARCVRLYGKDYKKRPDGAKNDCDEYPFAATYQNSNYDTGGPGPTWIVKPVLLAHNRSAGSILGKWLKDDHRLDGDLYFVHISNAPQ